VYTIACLLLAFPFCLPAWSPDAAAAAGLDSRSHLQTPEVGVAWRCYTAEVRLGRTLWQKTHALLTALYRTYPSRTFYLKMDVDALILPRSLLQYLSFLRDAAANSPTRGQHDATLPLPPLYFGSSAQVNNALFCSQPHCLFRSAPWRSLRGGAYKANLTNSPHPLREHRASATAHGEEPAGHAGHGRGGASYAAGGVYGFSRAALALIVGSDDQMPPSGSCLHDAAAAVQAYRDAGHRIAHMAEDELVGLCMQLHSVPLVECPCFYQYGPCDVHNFTTCADGTRSSRLCRLPISIHKLKRVSWYKPWFEQLRRREPQNLAELLL
jgi:hypothetical protein